MATLLWKRWNQFWFSSSDRYQYGLFRILFVFALFVVAWDEWQFSILNALSSAPAEFAAPHSSYTFSTYPSRCPQHG